MESVEDVLAAVQAISREISAATAECAKRHAPGVTGWKTELTLVGDPDVGTLIDATTPVVDGSGAALPPAFDDCVRDEFQTLALPPLRAGDTFKVTYSDGL